MLDPRRRSANRLLYALASCLLAAACVLPGLAEPEPAGAAPWTRAFGGAIAARCTAVPTGDRAFALPVGSGLLVVPAAGERGPELTEGQYDALAKFVQDGGRLVLFGDAARWVARLGVDDVAPEGTWFRWGFDARTDLGRAELGLKVVSGKLPELTEGVPPSDAGPDTCFLAGGAPCRVRTCGWPGVAPTRGHVLAHLARRLDGVDVAAGEPVLVHWSCGRGDVLACGLVPDLQSGEADVQTAAVAFAQKCAQWANRGALTVWLDAPVPAPVPDALPPMAPLVPHWGWQVPPIERTATSLDDEVQAALVGSFEAGADLSALSLADAEGRTHVGWPLGDPLRPAPNYRGDAGDGFGADAIARWSREAHARGMLVFGDLTGVAAGGGFGERCAVLRFLARELADQRRFGDAALDGFALRQWFADGKGYGVSMLQDFAPGASLWHAGEPAGPFAGGVRALHGDDGAPRSLPWSGIAGSWRAGHPADEFPLAVLEARVGFARTLGELPRGGAGPDWLVQQANDFVRAREGRGGGFLWNHHGDGVAVFRDYAEGLALEPLRAAVVMPLSATGSDGLRAAAAGLFDSAPPGFAASVESPCSVHVVQNNRFQMLGSGGALRFDPTGRAAFGEARLLSPAFLRTRLFGGRPDGNALRADRTDFLLAGRGEEGAYAEIQRIGAAGERRVPRVLAGDERPAWPRAVWLEWSATPGYHELVLHARPLRGAGVLTVSLDGTLLRAMPFRSDALVARIPVHCAVAGTRLLQLQIEHGGACAIDRLEITREGDVGVESRVVVPAGARAVLHELSQSSYHSERVEVLAQADLPAFVLRLANERSIRNLQVERVFALPGYTLATASGGEAANELRQPFVLRADDAAAPDVVVVPMHLARYERLVATAGQLTMRSTPDPGWCTKLGFWLCEHGDGEALLPHAPRLLAMLEQPPVLDLAGVGEATLVGDLPIASTRVVQVAGRRGAPFAVCEQGWWQWRGSQPGPDDSRWLRVAVAPGDTVRVVGGPAVLARTRPGPGSQRLLALRDPEPLAATVRVVQPSGLAAPSVVFASDFDAVSVDGRPWDWFDGRTVFLPDRAATWRVQGHARGVERPHVRSTRAPLRGCEYVPERRELVLDVAPDARRPAELPWTAVLAGPRPVAIDNGEIVADESLRLPDDAQLARARNGGTLVRFRAGITRIRYAP